MTVRDSEGLERLQRPWGADLEKLLEEERQHWETVRDSKRLLGQGEILRERTLMGDCERQWGLERLQRPWGQKEIVEEEREHAVGDYVDA